MQHTIACKAIRQFAANVEFAWQGMEICGSIPELAHTPVCMDCWRRPSSATEEVLAVGDIGGYVTLFNLAENASEPKRSENRSADQSARKCCERMTVHLT